MIICINKLFFYQFACLENTDSHLCRLIYQVVVEDGHGSHGFHHGYGTWQNTRVVTAAGLNNGIITIFVHGGLLSEQSGYRLERHTEVDILSVADAALNASAVVGQCGDVSAVVAEDIILLTSPLTYAVESLSVFKTFHRIDGQHGTAQGSMQLAESRFSKSYRAALDDAGDDAADGIALRFHFTDELFHFGSLVAVWAAHDITLYPG